MVLTLLSTRDRDSNTTCRHSALISVDVENLGWARLIRDVHDQKHFTVSFIECKVKHIRFDARRPGWWSRSEHGSGISILSDGVLEYI
jgi:hypothetical protein